MASFYKHHIMDWRSGTSSLSDRAYRVYHVIIEEIMLNDGPVPLHERSLAGKSNRSTRDFRAALAELVAAEKVIVKDGFLHNPRAEAELDAIQKSREKYPKSPRKVDEYSANSPRIVRELEEKPNDINGDSLQIRKDKIREDKKDLVSAPARSKKGTRLPDDWQPNPDLIATASKLGLSAAQFDREVEKFRDYWAGRAGSQGVKLDWDATARNWMRTAAERANPPPRNTPSQQGTPATGVWINRGTPQWQAWAKARGKEPYVSVRNGDEGAFFRTEWPQSEGVAA